MVKDMTAVVAAASPHRGIGYQGILPWKLPGDMEHFKKVTTGMYPENTKNAVIMGRKTWESIPEKFRPLPDRINVVLTRQENLEIPSSVITASSLCDAETKLVERGCRGEVFVIGGADVYQQAITEGYVNTVIYTEIEEIANAKFDAYFPELSVDEWEMTDYYREDNNKENGSPGEMVDPKTGISYRFLKYKRREQKSQNLEEMQYLDLCREVLETGIRRGDRTGTGTLSKFGTQMRFSLRDDTLPLLTTKRTFWRGVAEELLWFVKGSTNANDLAAKDIHIWDGNGSREFLDSRGLSHREVGDLGPVYGFQWRHFGAKYVDMHTDYTGQGVDQLAECIEKIKNNPEDRRIIMSAWNPSDLTDMALPPCHMFCQFYVDIEKNELSCQMYQRSADLGLGVPFNIASYALLTRMVAQVTGRKAGDFIHTIGDAHIYVNHIDALKEQLEREPRPFPKLKINPDKVHIDDFQFSDFEVVGYNPHKAIKMTMAV